MSLQLTKEENDELGLIFAEVIAYDAKREDMVTDDTRLEKFIWLCVDVDVGKLSFSILSQYKTIMLCRHAFSINCQEASKHENQERPTHQTHM